MIAQTSSNYPVHQNSQAPIAKTDMEKCITQIHQLEINGDKVSAQKKYSEVFWAHTSPDFMMMGCTTKETQAGFIYAILKKEYGPTIANFLYGKIALLGDNVKQDNKIAVQRFALAYNEGYQPAADNLKQMFLAGQGIEIDPSLALKILKEASKTEQEHWEPEALYQFANMLEQETPSPDPSQEDSIFNNPKEAAIHFYKLATGQGHSASLFKLVELTVKKGTKDDYVAARTYLQLGVSKGISGAQHALNSMPAKIYAKANNLWTSKHKDQNESEALKLYEYAAELGDADAMFQLYQINHFAMGEITFSDKNREENALHWLNLAAKSEHLGAKEILADKINHKAFHDSFHKKAVQMLNSLALGKVDNYFSTLSFIKEGVKEKIEGAEQKLAIFLSVAFVKAIVLWDVKKSILSTKKTDAGSLLVMLADEGMSEAMFKLYEINYKNDAGKYLDDACNAGHHEAIEVRKSKMRESIAIPNNLPELSNINNEDKTL